MKMIMNSTCYVRAFRYPRPDPYDIRCALLEKRKSLALYEHRSVITPPSHEVHWRARFSAPDGRSVRAIGCNGHGEGAETWLKGVGNASICGGCAKIVKVPLCWIAQLIP